MLPKNLSFFGHGDDRDDIVYITFFSFFTAKPADHYKFVFILGASLSKQSESLQYKYLRQTIQTIQLIELDDQMQQ